jgi:23S rRNA pseudouridine2605 synthase
MIANGEVRVNRLVVRKLGTLVCPSDRVEIGGKHVRPAEERAYVVMHKPAGVVTTMRDPQGRRTVAQLLRRGPRVVPVGRLDYDTSGVLLLTDDGALAHRLSHPRFGVEKTYRAVIEGRLSALDARRLRSGAALGFQAAQAKLRIVAARRDASVVDITIHEGRNRQVRRMFEAVGHPVVRLARLRFGPISLGDLAPGRTRQLTKSERRALERYRDRPEVP